MPAAQVKLRARGRESHTATPGDCPARLHRAPEPLVPTPRSDAKIPARPSREAGPQESAAARTGAPAATSVPHARWDSRPTFLPDLLFPGHPLTSLGSAHFLLHPTLNTEPGTPQFSMSAPTPRLTKSSIPHS